MTGVKCQATSVTDWLARGQVQKINQHCQQATSFHKKTEGISPLFQVSINWQASTLLNVVTWLWWKANYLSSKTLNSHKVAVLMVFKDCLWVTGLFLIPGVLIGSGSLQRWTIRWALGCVNSRPAARRSQVAVFTQPSALLIAHLCMWDKSLCITTLT